MKYRLAEYSKDVNIMPEDITRRQSLRSRCCLQNGINKGSICVKPCDNASGTWEIGNVLYRCDLYNEAVDAFDKANETWPWVRSRRESPQTAHPSIGLPSIRNSQILERISRWFFQLY
jgi:hypothetical protein